MSTAANGSTAAQVLDACRHFLGRIRLQDLVEQTGFTTTRTRFAVQTLVSRGLLSWVDRGTYRLTPNGFEALVGELDLRPGPRGPRHELPQTGIRTRVWRALRLQQKGSIRDLLTLASRGEALDREDTKKYLGALTKAGYLRRLQVRGEHRETRYLLIRDTGPKAPQWDKRRARVHDANTGTTYELA